MSGDQTAFNIRERGGRRKQKGRPMMSGGKGILTPTGSPNCHAMNSYSIAGRTGVKGAPARGTKGEAEAPPPEKVCMLVCMFGYSNPVNVLKMVLGDRVQFPYMYSGIVKSGGHPNWLLTRRLVVRTHPPQ